MDPKAIWATCICAVLSFGTVRIALAFAALAICPPPLPSKAIERPLLDFDRCSKTSAILSELPEVERPITNTGCCGSPKASKVLLNGP